MSEARSMLSTALAVLLLTACGGGDGPTDPGDGGGGGGGGGGGDVAPRTVKANPSFGTDIQEIFTRNGCTASGCHGDGTGAGLMLGSSASANHGALVGVPSTSQASFHRVKPNDAANSYLMIKLEGRQTVGARMPLGGAPLDDVDLTNLRNWINNGAPNN